MNIKRAFLAAVAVCMLPGYAMAQSTVFFDVGANFFGADGSATATLTCNAGLPLEQSAEVGGPARVTFTVTQFIPGTCTVSFAATGFETAGVDVNMMFMPDDDECVFGVDGEAVVTNNMCTARFQPGPFTFEVPFSWDVSETADELATTGVTIEGACFNVWDASSSALTDYSFSGANGELGGMPNPIVIPDLRPDPRGSTSCVANWAFSTLPSAAEGISDCAGGVSVPVGTMVASCPLSASLFYEGIPTLSQYGMAIMVLLMLGVGFVGFRRFV